MLEWLFGSKQKTYPILKPEMLQPTDSKITAADAKRIFKDWMLKIGYLEKGEVGDHVGYLADDMREREQEFKEDIKYAKDNLAEEMKTLKGEIANLKKKLSTSKDEAERADIEEAIADAEENITSAKDEAAQTISDSERDLAAFKEDKRAFLIKYINDQVHGNDWNDIAPDQ